VYVIALLNEAIEQVRGLAGVAEIWLEMDAAVSLPPLQADSSLLRRVLVNLIGNAITYSPAGECVRLSACADPVMEETLLIGVHDHGPGIPVVDRERIFEKWGQLESRAANEKPSSGLGLTFCRLVIEAHGGQVWADESGEEDGAGSVFYIRLPLQSMALPNEPGTPPASGHPATRDESPD